QGHLMTHVAGNQVDPGYLASIAARGGAAEPLRAEMAAATTARRVQEMVQAAGLDGFFDLVADAAAWSCWGYVEGALSIECLLFDFDGTLLGRAAVEKQKPAEGERT